MEEALDVMNEVAQIVRGIDPRRTSLKHGSKRQPLPSFGVPGYGFRHAPAPTELSEFAGTYVVPGLGRQAVADSVGSSGSAPGARGLEAGESKLGRVVREIIETEEQYHDQLSALKGHYVHGLAACLAGKGDEELLGLTQEELHSIFGALGPIVEVSHAAATRQVTDTGPLLDLRE